ncbi:TraR/DksA family transcriptional regulator [Kiloniella laminariae]|uniref:TraR/DksA family transcriptional regulator n=1 Tax=Kiloniella laminariae TaxID=454162 RepID=A0ABT4LMX4_9PROT|nr:TraR/DksA family transcriptional regulator [Kiloniella laminariae]MCZ4282437.1 TraR/DksA family transcriptional regulator [Kiloniella laminariae]
MLNLKKIESDLRARMEDLGERVDQIEQDLREPHSKDWGENATESEGDQVLEGLEEAGLDEINQIRAALTRIENESYGVCSGCGEDIPEARLRALPYATTCVNCAK